MNNRSQEPDIITPRTKSLLRPQELLNNSTTPPSLKENQTHNKTQKKVSFINAYPVVKIHEHDFQFPKRVVIKDLLKEYNQECEKNKVKVIDKLEKQLSEIEFAEEAIPRIDLKGTRLDYKTCESLELIFMNLQTNCLDLESTMLDEDSCVSICEIIEYYNSARCLNIGSNTRIGVRGWTALSQLISRTQSIEILDLNRMVFTEHAVSNMAKGFRLTTTLKVLHLENCYLNGARLNNLLKSFIDSQMVIEELYLGENKITSLDCESISTLIKGYPILRVLDLQNNPLQDLGLKFIFTGLYEREDAHLEILQLWNTNITATGMTFISAYFTENLHKNQLYYIRSLNIGKNKIGDEGALVLKSSLIKNHTLQRLGLVSTRLSTTGIITVAEIIADNKSLLRVDIRENAINLAAVIALNQAMRHNNTVLKLNFNPNFKIEAGMETEVESVLNQIRTKCDENRNKSKTSGKTDDIMSLISAFSTDSVANGKRDSTQSNSSSVSSFILNILTSPFRLSKSRLFGYGAKPEIENPSMGVISEVSEQLIPKSSTSEGSSESVKTGENLAETQPQKKDEVEIKISQVNENIIENNVVVKSQNIESEAPKFNVSRFEVRKVPQGVAQHRRSRSDITNHAQSNSALAINLNSCINAQLSINSSLSRISKENSPLVPSSDLKINNNRNIPEEPNISDGPSLQGAESTSEDNAKPDLDLNDINHPISILIPNFSQPDAEKNSIGVSSKA